MKGQVRLSSLVGAVSLVTASHASVLPAHAQLSERKDATQEPRPAATQPATETLEADPAPKPLSGFIDGNLYRDTRGFSTLTVNLLANLPFRFQYFSLTNYEDGPGSDHPHDVERYLTEQNLRWNPLEALPLDLAVQWMHRSGPANDVLRPGMRIRVMNIPGLDAAFQVIHLMYFVTLFPAQVDFVGEAGYRAQAEHVYRLDILPDLLDRRLYVAGFLDHNFWFDGPAGTRTSTILTEHQLGLRLVGHFHLVLEARRNEFLTQDKNGLGIGLQYLIPFQYKH